MEKKKKPGFFSTLKDELVRGLSPARSRPPRISARTPSPAPSFLRLNSELQRHVADPEPSIVGRSSSVGVILAPLVEGPDPESCGSRQNRVGLGHWFRTGSSNNNCIGTGATTSSKVAVGSDMRLLLGVMGAPLAPVHVSSSAPLPHLSIKDTPIETSSAQYILQQYTAATGGRKLQSSIRNAYAMGKFKMIASEMETASTRVTKTRNASKKDAHSGGFVLWQMNPDMWYVELAVGGTKFHAGCNGKLVWRHTPWLGAHTAKGPVRPLRRALQGLDPRTTASMFASARCIGEKKINGEDCFILKLSADPWTLKARSEGPAEIIRHVMFGYFSQRTGLLLHIEDSHLTRIQSNGGDVAYWETTINSFLDDYRPVEGIMIAHSGRSVVTLFRFGEMAMSHTKTRMEEAWAIDEVAFNVQGLSVDCFIPPADLRSNSPSEACEQIPQDARDKRASGLAGYRAKIAAFDKSMEI